MLMVLKEFLLLKKQQDAKAKNNPWERSSMHLHRHDGANS
jgi:hypothetical protein